MFFAVPKSKTTLSEFDVDLKTFDLRGSVRFETGKFKFSVDGVSVALSTKFKLKNFKQLMRFYNLVELVF
jgi:hypothetical protein